MYLKEYLQKNEKNPIEIKRMSGYSSPDGTTSTCTKVLHINLDVWISLIVANYCLWEEFD
jgi:hypothetical protein